MHTIPVSDNSCHPSQQRQHKPLLLLLLLLCRNYVHGASALYILIPLTHSRKKHSQLQSETTPHCSLYNRLVDTKRAFLSGPVTSVRIPQRHFVAAIVSPSLPLLSSCSLSVTKEIGEAEFQPADIYSCIRIAFYWVFLLSSCLSPLVAIE